MLIVEVFDPQVKVGDVVWSPADRWLMLKGAGFRDGELWLKQEFCLTTQSTVEIFCNTDLCLGNTESTDFTVLRHDRKFNFPRHVWTPFIYIDNLDNHSNGDCKPTASSLRTITQKETSNMPSHHLLLAQLLISILSPFPSLSLAYFANDCLTWYIRRVHYIYLDICIQC